MPRYVTDVLLGISYYLYNCTIKYVLRQPINENFNIKYNKLIKLWKTLRDRIHLTQMMVLFTRTKYLCNDFEIAETV